VAGEQFYCCIKIPFTASGKDSCMLSLGHFSRVWNRLKLDTTITLTGIDGALDGLADALLRVGGE